MDELKITDIPGFKLGNAQDTDAATGCTAIICEGGATAGADVRGGAPGTRETDLLRPENFVEKIHGVILAGGSSFGLEAAGGVAQYLEERGVGFDVGVTKVPIVPAAVLFDLPCGDFSVRPDKKMGYAACLAADSGVFGEGTAGAGTGATVGKFFGMEHAMKGGLGTFCVKVGEVIVGAVVAVNSLGDVVDPASGRIVAGAFAEEPFRFLNCEDGIIRQCGQPTNLFAGHTTIGAVLTNAALTKSQATKVAAIAQNGFARAIRPVHTMFDGDTVFCLSHGNVRADVSAVGVLAVRVMERAIVNAVRKATPLAGFKTCLEMNPALRL